MLKKKGGIGVVSVILVFVLIVVIIGVLFLVSKRDCMNLNEELKQECKLCSDSNEPVDCRELIYRDFAVLSKDLEICDNINRDYMNRDCLLKTSEAISMSSRGLGGPRSAPILSEDGVNYRFED